MSSQDLDVLLRALREDTRGVQAPQQVEDRLLQAFRAEARLPGRRRPAWTAWALGAAASIAGLIGAATYKLNQPLAVLPPVKFAFSAPPVIVQPGLPKIEHRVAARRAKRPHPAADPKPPVETEVATEFIPLEDTLALPPVESVHVLRVQMPRSNMMRLGFPVNPDRMMEPVKADVVFGQDGIARAVRFVK